MPIILYQDAFLAVVEKPSGLLMHRSDIAPDKVTLVEKLQELTGKKVFLPHRLDRQTSGVCVITFDSETAAALQKLFSERTIRKSYLALVRGQFPDFLSVERPLTDDSGKPKESKTEFACLQRYDQVSLIRANPLTGRRHQIRRHLAHQAHHIIGDTTYGKGGINREFRAKSNLHRLFLHAESLVFVHPRTGVEMRVESVLPEELSSVLSLLKRVAN